ncbi:SAM-dependent methyltransferase, partial [Streptomyces sp. SID10244]|nr:SAM-dependent methyltransferase [Streptomyces sp. SID10244]
MTLRQAARLAPGSTLVMTYLLPTDLIEDADRSGLKTSEEGAKASGTPFVSFYTPAEAATLARDAGLTNIRQVTGTSLGERYLAGRTDCPRP